MKDYTVCFVGTDDTYKLLGKSASASDIEFRHYTKGDKTVTFVSPKGFPEKIKPLIQALNIADYLIIELKSIDKELAELMVAADLLKKQGIFIVSQADQILLNQLSDLIKGTVFENYEIRILKSNEDLVNLRALLLEKESVTKDNLEVIIDQAFEVKNVGLVVLGYITGGRLSARDQCLLYPGKRLIQVKTIQCMDVDCKEITAKARVGLSLKNCKIDDVSRGCVIVKDELKELNELSGNLTKVKYYKEELKPGSQVIAVNNLLSVTGLIKKTNPDLIIELQKPIVKTMNETVLIDPDSKSLRVIGLV